MKTCCGRKAIRVCLALMGYSLAAIAQGPPYLSGELLRERLWVWGNPEMAQPGPHTVDTFAAASPAERAALLGTPNIIMAGNGLPRTPEQADTWTAEVANAPRLVWEITVDDEKGGPPFTFDQTVARLADVVKKYPQVEGVLLDDMSTMMVDRGFKPEHIRALRDQLNQACPELKIWGVVYSMNLDKPELAAYIQELDVVNLWVWHASDTAEIERYVQQVHDAFPSKPIVLGLYLYDYGTGQRMSRGVLERQCATALDLLKVHRIEGLVFLTINDDPETVSYAANWTRTHAGTPVGNPEMTVSLSMEFLDGWLLSDKGWYENKEGLIQPPDVRNLHSRAFQTDYTFRDFTAEFEFNGNYRETGTGAAGMILRAQDANHFYYVYFPWGGQQLRAKHFWAAIAKVEGDGYLRNLAADWIPGLPSETDRWYQVRVQARGPEICVWVDGREALTVRDDAYAQGAAGFAGYGWYAFRNARITGAPSPAMKWETSVSIPSHAFTIGLTSAEMPSSCIAPNGDVLVAAGNQLVRSSDKGRTWQAPETLPESLGTITDYGSGMFRTSQGRLMVMLYANDPKQPGIAPSIQIAESTDNGHTWVKTVPSTIAPEWPAFPTALVPYGPVTEAKDGALLRFLLGGAKEEGTLFTDVRTFGATRAKAYVIRSSDGGLNWTAPIELDRPRWTDMERGGAPGSLDFTEPTAVVIGDTVTALIRPIYSPYMWQCWSYDGGVTWDAASRATFPGYAQSMVRTASGAILCAHRFPQYSVNVSRDGGLNWDAGTVIDYPVWGMGTALEIEPDAVLFTYMNAERAMPLLAQLVRVTPSRVEPVPAGKG